MNKHGLLGLLLIITGVLLLAYSVVYGEGKVMILLIIPVFYGSDIFAFIGVLSIMGGIFLLFMSYAENIPGRMEQEGGERKAQKPAAAPKRNLRAGGVVLIGPIPIILGSDMKMAVIAMILAIVLIVAAIFLFLVVL